MPYGPALNNILLMSLSFSSEGSTPCGLQSCKYRSTLFSG